MINNIIENEDYKELICTQVKQTIEFLISQGQEFAITANIDSIKFEPQLPDAIFSQLSKFSLFVLSNYTYSTVKIDDDYIYFEAGFGSENFGSNVKIPLYGIFQIIVDESILFINSVATVDKFNKDPKAKSLNVFKNNPNNKNLLK
ncbi:hypothetical protein [Halarcobacter anaerophilus]|jgi:hypothetical protein|uniref:Stringent starvation protein B n=1 Tax=Halarcobacter anaerophilus TaxID=877500 RepID=A0A4Q0Y4A2_9BACT|nr:hypothetical protein [Halarcobacter anaerophilus]QDF30045.1 hypothetical protein AANAER_2599 [Halarcobacter anaerophilus]RXJ63091.1 hypothetical protein CRV06_07470 [Halarcobacter anaerophilus]